MRLLIGDYSGHPFQVQLSRALASRGHEVLHLFSASFETPKGALRARKDDPPTLQFLGVQLDEPSAKRNLIKRRRQEIMTGASFAEAVERFKPQLAILSNQPIDTLARTIPALERVGSSFVFWIQDLIGEAASRILSRRVGPLGALIGYYYSVREARFLRRADHVVAIAEEFKRHLVDAIGIDAHRVSVIENWSPVGDIPSYPRDNDWARSHLRRSPLRIIYSGTLGFKHDPELLLELAAGLQSEITVFSQGAGARALAASAADRCLPNLAVRPWVDFDDLPRAFAGGDLFVVLLEPDAGTFSVPSKVLTYMCVGRPILGAIPSSNPAARLIREVGCGITVEPHDKVGFLKAAQLLAGDPAGRERMGRAARLHAERAFDIERITDRFDSVIDAVMAGV